MERGAPGRGLSAKPSTPKRRKRSRAQHLALRVRITRTFDVRVLGGPDERIPCRVTADVFASGLVEVRAVVDEDGREQVIGDDEEDRIAPRESSYV